jgi:hypothetical protein
MEKGRLKVDDRLRVVGFKNVWAIGDISNREQAKGYLALKQAEYLAEYFSKVVHGKASSFPAYVPAPPLSIVSIGRNHGVSQMGGRVYGSTFTKFVKSKEMFVNEYWDDLNMDRKTRKPVKVSGAKYTSLAQAMQVTEEKAQKIKHEGLPAFDLDEHERKEAQAKRQEAQAAGMGVSVPIEDSLLSASVFAVLKQKVTSPELFLPVTDVVIRVSDDGLGIYREMSIGPDRAKANIYTNESKLEIVFKLVGEETEHINAIAVDEQTGSRHLEFFARDSKSMNRVNWSAPRQVVLDGMQKVLEKARPAG